jgi:D-glycero-D-manno-heptose 1,7-bisphosphate phosphatase
VAQASHAAVFLDRDGVINRSPVRGGKPFAPRRLEEFRLLPGVAAQAAALRELGYLLVVITNQPDIGHGLLDWQTLNEFHNRLRARIAPDAIMVCPHRQDEGCDCRKPRPGMLLEAARRLTIDFGQSYVIGDRWSDIEAGRTVGCYTILINRGYKSDRFSAPDATARSLRAAVALVRQRTGTRGKERSDAAIGRAQD